MRKLFMLSCLLGLFSTPPCAYADGGGGTDPGGDPFAILQFYAEAAIVPFDQEHPIEAAGGEAMITIDATKHKVGIMGANSGEYFYVRYDNTFDVNGTIDTATNDDHTVLIVCDALGKWSHSSAMTSSNIILPVGSYTAHVNSDMVDQTHPTINYAHQTATSGFTIL